MKKQPVVEPFLIDLTRLKHRPLDRENNSQKKGQCLFIHSTSSSKVPLQPLTLSDLRRQLRLTKAEARKVQTILKSHEHEPIPLRQQWVISITIKIRGMEFPRATALLDSGFDLNCIRKDLVPVHFRRKSGEQAGGQRLDVSLQVQKVHVCYQRLCLLFHFVLLENLDYDLLLGTPFLSTICPFTSTKEGVHGNFNGKPVLF